LHLHHHEERQQPEAERSPSTEELFAGLPEPTVPTRKHAFERHLPEVSLAQIKAGIEDEENGLFQQFMNEAMSCLDMSSTPWDSFFPVPGVRARRMAMRYDMHAPKDVPDVAKRIVKLPAIIKGNSVSWYRCIQDGDAECLVMMQRCASEGIMYSDRFYVQFHYEIKRLPEGGVVLRQWSQTVWKKALPWTHSILTNILEKKVKTDCTQKVVHLVALLENLNSTHAD
jgi:hypothetical protein